jgi:hypothetical protein
MEKTKSLLAILGLSTVLGCAQKPQTDLIDVSESPIGNVQIPEEYQGYLVKSSVSGSGVKNTLVIDRNQNPLAVLYASDNNENGFFEKNEIYITNVPKNHPFRDFSTQKIEEIYRETSN